MSFIAELKRRNVVKVAVLYVVAAWLLLQVADVLSSLLPVPDWTGSLVFILLVLGFPPAIIFSWVYEITPEGIKREKDVDRSQSITEGTGRKINILIIALLIVAISVMTWNQFSRHSPATSVAPVMEHPADTSATKGSEPAKPGPPRQSIAVLPFVNMSSDPEQAYFSDGLSEELLNLLAQIPGLTVASRTSAFSFKDKEVTIGQIADALNVSHILEGSVRKSGDRIRITAQLIDTTRDVHVWSQTWDRQLGDIFAIQDEIASAVVDELKVALLGKAPASAETDPEAYNVYLQARQQARSGSPDGLAQAVQLFRKALSMDPGYAPAWVGLSAAYVNMAGGREIDPDEGYAQASAATDQALAIDPENGEAYAIRGWLAGNHDGNLRAAAGYYRQALALAPNSDRVLNGAAVLLQSLGRIDESLRVFQVLTRRDPLSAVAHHNLAIAYYLVGDLASAQAQMDQALTLSPDMTSAHMWRTRLLAMQGDYQEVLEEVDRLAELTGNEGFRLLGKARVDPAIGRPEEGSEALAALEQHYAKRFVGPIAAMHLQRGDIDGAIDWLEKARLWVGTASLAFARIDPEFAPLRDTPRFQALLEAAGLTDAQLNDIDFEVQVPE